MHSMGWAQLAHFAQVRAFAEGQAEIDQWHWETKDKAYVDGHFYSVKSPGVPALSLPVFLLIDTEPGRDLNQAAVENAREPKYPRWQPQGEVPLENFGYDPGARGGLRGPDRAERPDDLVPGPDRRGDPGGAAALRGALGRRQDRARLRDRRRDHAGARHDRRHLRRRVLLARDRRRARLRRLPRPDARAGGAAEHASSSPLAGLAAGLAVTFEYQVGLVGVVLFFYALAREAPRLPRAAAYVAAAFAGAIPALAFNLWAFGSPLEFAYGSAVDDLGRHRPRLARA